MDYEGFYDDQLSVTPDPHLTDNGFQNQVWSTLENEEMNLSMDVTEFHDTRNPSYCVPNRELKMSKKIVPDNYPTNVKKLLSTRILEGARVKYISISGMVGVALLRIFGRDVAELPLVARARENHGKGYFQALFSCIERLLSSMSVKHLVLPAAEEAEPMWTNKLGFRKTSYDQMLRYRDFQLTSLLEKELQN